MSTCTYRINDASGKEVVITGQADMKAFLADGGLEQLLPGKVLPWSAENEATTKAPASDSRDSFTLQRLNQETGAMESQRFERGQYVKALLSGSGDSAKWSHGEIEGLSQSRREAKVDGVWFPFGAIYSDNRPAVTGPKTVPMSEVVASINAKNGEGVTEADRILSLSDLNTLQSALRDGTATVEQYRNAWAAFQNSADTIRTELTKKTKAQLLDMVGPMLAYRMKGDNKPEIVKQVFEAAQEIFTLGRDYGPQGYFMGERAKYEADKRKALSDMIEATTAEDLKAYAEKVAGASAERAAKRAAVEQAIADPKTLEDFRTAMRAKIQGGKTRSEAFLELTPEQRVRYDELEAEETRESREARKRASKTEVRVASQTTGAQIVEGVHSKHGYPLWSVQLADKVDGDSYKTLLSTAKRMGGNYVNTMQARMWKTVWGFQFREKDKAEAFMALAAGDASAAKEAVEERRNAFDDDRSQSAVERLREMADRLEDSADEQLSRDRKANTARRARFAAAAEAAANSDKALAKTMRNIAQAIEDGKAKFLDAVRTKTQVEALSGYVSTAKDRELQSKYQSYADQDRHKGEPATAETADFAGFPSYRAYRSDFARLARQMIAVDGTKKLGQRLMTAADDVTDAYLVFAKTNLLAVSQFGRGGVMADFPVREDAEQAIRRSGLVGKAIVLPVKRGQNRVILSPSEAITRKVWAGEQDKQITLTPEFGAELVEAIGRRGNKQNGLSVPWQLQTAYDRRKALSRLGIETPAEFRSALREFIALRQAPAEADKVKQMERAMIGRRNDGLDFFPTPAGIAQQMVDAADLKEGMTALEPSAGMGHIAERIREAGVDPDVVEFSSDRRELLEAKGFNVVANDFMDATGSYDRIIMNPPFSDRRDAAHVEHAYSLLKPGGRIVAIMGEGVFFGQDKKAEAFRDWLDSVGGTSEKLPEGSFLDPSLPVNTGVNARMVVIDKPADSEAPAVLRTESDLTETPAFIEWFGRSKMTNKDGEPLLFMHGSPASFEAFDTDKLSTSSSHTSSGLGHFFTRDKVTAEKYADGGNIYTGWLKIEKPYVMMIEEAQAFDDAQDSAKRRKELQKMGYDGVVILDDDGKPWATVAFEPWQFKSTDNNGAFDEFDDRMRFRNEDQAMRDTSTMRYTGDVPRKDAEDFIRKFVAEYPGAPSIMLVDSFDQLPKDIQKDALAQGSGPTRAKGAMKNGATYVVLNNHHSMADLEATIFHEILGHSGVRKMFGPEFSQELNRLFVGLGGYSGLQKIMEQRGLALQFHGYFDAIHQAKERNPRAWTDALAQSILTEEVFAHIAEQKNGKKLRDRFMALIGMVRDWLRRHGFASLADLGESDIVFLLQKAREGLREGEGVLREGTHVGEREIVDADGRPVARESSPDYEAIKTISGRLGLREREAPTVFQTAWHGSPHKFDKFSLDAIGTGEGAQAYGWGLYFAGEKEVAEYYREQLSRPQIAIDGVPLKFQTDDKAAALRNIIRNTKRGMPFGEAVELEASSLESSKMPSKMADAKELRSIKEGSLSEVKSGALYQVEIPNDGEYLLWDKPLSEQPIAVREMLVPVLERWYGKGNADYVMTNPKSPVKDGKDLVIALGYNMQASKILLDAGIAGIKYLDGTSRNSGEGNYNYVVFDDSRVDTVSVLRAEFSAPEFRQKARDAVANLTDGLRGETARSLNWWDRTVGTQNGKAKKDADFGRVYHHAHAFLDGVSDFANRAADKARGILPHLDSWRDIGAGLNVRKQWADSKDYQAISKAIFDGTLVNGTSGKVWSDEELKEKYGLNEKQIGFYREFRAAVDFSLETLAASEMSRLARASKLEVADRDMDMDDAKDFYVKQIEERLKEARAAIDSTAGAVVARHMEERAAVEDAFDDFASEESKEIIRKEMERRHKTEIDEVMKAVNDLEALRDSFIDKADKIHELQEQGYAPLMRFGEYTVDVVRLDKDGKPVMDEDGNPDRPFFGMFESEAEARKAEKALAEEYPGYTVTRGVLSVEASQLYRGLTPETAELFARMLGTDTDDAFQAYLKQAVANRSAMKRLIHRMGMEGFSNDVPRVLASFITSNARLSSGNWHFGDMSKAVEAIPKHKGDIKDEAIRLMQYIQNPQEEAAGLRGFLFFNFLGGSIASALVNLTQTFTTTLPYLNQFGPASVAKALPKAMTLAGKMMTKRGLDSVEDKGLREALQRAQDEGVVDPQEIHLLMAESQGNGASSSVSSLLGMVNKEWATPAARVTRAATQAWGSLFGAAEKYNRHVAFIAAWEVAPEGVDRYEFAKNAVTETQFDYTKASRPNWGRGAIGATLFAFKTFTISYIEFLSRLPSRERALAVAVLFLFAGMSGMPGADDLDDVIDTIGQKMGYNWNNAGSRHAWIVKTLGHDGANFVEHGISSMLPLDVSSRLGVGNIVPGTGVLKKSNQSASRDVQEFFGPAGSMVAAGRDVFDAAGSGKGAVDVALPILPKMFRDLRQAVDMWETGSYNDMKGRKVVDVSKVDALIKGIGFQPNTVAEPRRVERMLAQSSGMQRAIRDDIHELMARGRVEGDADKQEAARELMRSWNEKNPDAPIRLNPASLAQRTRAMRLTSADRLVKATPKEMRGAIAAELETQR